MTVVNAFFHANYLFILFSHCIVSLLFIYFEVRELTTLYYIVSIFIFAFTLKYNAKNMLFFIRTLFLGVIGFLAQGAKMIDENSIFSLHLQVSQTVEIAALMFLLTNVALFGNEVGLKAGFKVNVIKKDITTASGGSTSFYMLFFLFIFLSFLISLTSESVIGSDVVYGTGSGVELPVHTVPTMANIILFMLILLYFKFKNCYEWRNTKKFLYLIFFGIFFLFLYSELIRGIRLHALNGIFGLILLNRIYNNEDIKLTWKYMLIGIIIFIVIQCFGILREVRHFSDINMVVDSVFHGFNRIISTNSGNSEVMFNQGTINNIAATFSGIIYFLNNNIVDFHYGRDYFDYILRIPPSFLYSNRPPGLAWIFMDNHYTSGGGFFELAEAYLNFGVIGVLVVPSVISFTIAYSYKSFLVNKYSLLSSILFFSIMSNLLRGSLYQTFALFKGVIVGFFILLIYYIISQLFLRKIDPKFAGK